MSTTTTTKAPRVTKAQRIEDIKALLVGDSVKYNTTVDVALAFLNHEQELISGRNNNRSNKPSKTQMENENTKIKIMEFFNSQPKDKGFTCSELIHTLPELSDMSTSKVSALVRQLIGAGVVVREVVKGKATFHAA